LGHVQRGGEPGAFDRILATRLGAGAVDCLMRGESGVLVGLKGNQLVTTPHEVVIASKKVLDPNLIQLASVLAH
jgi:6-phosphofructokinase 1